MSWGTLFISVDSLVAEGDLTLGPSDVETTPKESEDAFGKPRCEQPIEQRGDGEGLSGARGHGEHQVSAVLGQGSLDGCNGLPLVGA